MEAWFTLWVNRYWGNRNLTLQDEVFYRRVFLPTGKSSLGGLPLSYLGPEHVSITLLRFFGIKPRLRSLDMRLNDQNHIILFLAVFKRLE